MRLIFARHGQTFNNAEGKINGRLDDKTSFLTLQGVDEAIRLSHFVEKKNINFIYTSPLHRAVQTANHVSEKLNLKIKTDERLMECNFGEWEGKATKELNQTEWKKREKERYTYVYPGKFKGEKGASYNSMFPKVKSFIEEILKKHKKDDTILIICHTGIILNAWKYFEKWDDKTISKKGVSNHIAYVVDTNTDITEEIPY